MCVSCLESHYPVINPLWSLAWVGSIACHSRVACKLLQVCWACPKNHYTFLSCFLFIAFLYESLSTSTGHNRCLCKKCNRVLRLQPETWNSVCCMHLKKVFLAWALMRFCWFPSQGVETLDQIFVSTFVAFSFETNTATDQKKNKLGFIFLSRILWVDRQMRGSCLNGRNEKRVWRANGITN